MAGKDGERYVGFSSTSLRRLPWWQRLPRPIEIAGLRLWATLPSFVRSPLLPLGALFGEHRVSTTLVPGTEYVPGVADHVQDGFEPLENHTGALWIGRLWPEQHCRSVPETRLEWLDDPESDGRLWLVRSPWQSLALDDTFAVVWSWVERDRTVDGQLRQLRASEVLRWSEPQALAWLHRADDD